MATVVKNYIAKLNSEFIIFNFQFLSCKYIPRI